MSAEIRNSKLISIAEWHEQSQNGRLIPLRIPINGVSMYPLIRRNIDPVTLLPMKDAPQVGDIVLFSDPVRPRYVLHRVWRTEGDHVLTWGDNCDGPDGWLPLDCIWGKAILIERGHRLIKPNPKQGKKLAAFWHTAGRLYRKGYRLLSRIYHFFRRTR